jgi:hypothetical protein
VSQQATMGEGDSLPDDPSPIPDARDTIEPSPARGEGKSCDTTNFATSHKENAMGLVLAITILAIVLYYWLFLARLRQLPWWDAAVAETRAALERAGARARAFCGNSKTIAVAYAAELLGVLDEAKVLDWSQLVGAESAGRVMPPLHP